MKDRSFDIRNLFEKPEAKTKRNEHEDVFDLVERKIQSKRNKFKKRIQDKNSLEDVDETKLQEIPEVKESDSIEQKYVPLNIEVLRNEILSFEFDDRYVYDFKDNFIKKIAFIENYEIEIPFKPSLDEENLDIDNNVSSVIPLNYDPNNITDILKYSNTLEIFDRLLFLEDKIHLKDIRITKEILLTLRELQQINLKNVTDACFRCYESLVDNGDVIEDLYFLKKDIRVLRNILSTDKQNYQLLNDYLIFLNKCFLGNIKNSYCEDQSCVVCRLISPENFRKMLNVCENTEFHMFEEEKCIFDHTTFDEFLKIKFDLLDKIEDNNLFFYVLLGSTDIKIIEFLELQTKNNVYTRVLNLLFKTSNNPETLSEINVALDVFDKLHSILNIPLNQDYSIPFDKQQLNFYYEKFNELNLNYFHIELSVKELVKVFKSRTHEYTPTHNILTQPLTFSKNLFLPFSLIFILELILKTKMFPNFLIYEIYNKLNKFIVPFSFYERLFQNQKDHILHLLRVKELFKLYQLTQRKEYLAKALKYLDKKIYETKHKDKIYKFKLLKSKILLNLNQPLEAFYEIQRFNTIDKCKILAYCDIKKSLEEISKMSKNNKLELLFLELLVTQREDLPVGFLFTKDSLVDNSIVEQYLTKVKTFKEVKLSYIRYLKYRNLDSANKFADELLKNKKEKNCDVILYEGFIIKRRLGIVSYRVLYKDRQSDLLNQEISYIENKECDNSNKFYYLYLYKRIRKEGNKDERYLGYLLQEVIKGNGDCLVILYILYTVPIDTLSLLKTVYQVEDGFYWCRTRKITNFKERLLHTLEIFEIDQNY